MKIVAIEKCENCGVGSEDMTGGILRGIGEHCLECGASEGFWELSCKNCGNRHLWDEYSEYILPECPHCGTWTNDAHVVNVASGYIINHIFKDSSLHEAINYKHMAIPFPFAQIILEYVGGKKTT